MDNPVTFANRMGELLAPALIALRSTGFFEAPVFMSLMTLLSVGLFLRFRAQLVRRGDFERGARSRFRILWLFLHYSLWFLVTNALAVALKTMIVEEMDYDHSPWYLPWVSPLHFIIASLAMSHLAIVQRGRLDAIARGLVVYVQIGLLGGYAAGTHRLLTEPMNLLDPTSGVSGLVFLAWFAGLNADLLLGLSSMRGVSERSSSTRRSSSQEHASNAL